MSNNPEKTKSTKELIEELPEDRKAILEQFQDDLKNHPIRQLNKLERDIYGASITTAIERLPSFRDALAVLNPFMDATSSTAYTDKYARVGLSYWFFYIADNDTRAIALLHESMHVLNSHFSRGSNRGLKPRMMNISGDLEINSNLSLLPGAKTILKDFLLPDNEMFVFPYHKTLEQYATLIQDKLNENEEKREQEKNQQQDNADGSDSGDSSEGAESGNGDSSESDNESGEGQGSAGQSGSSGGSGSGQNESGQGESGDQFSDGDSQGQNQGEEPSGFGNTYDNFVDDMLDRKKKGSGGSLEDLLAEKEKCDGNHSSDGSGNSCDGSCKHDGQDGDGDGGDGDSDGDGDSGNGSLKDSSKQNSGGGKPQRVPKPSRSCDRSTDARSEAADEAGIDRSSVTEQNIARRNTRARVVEEINNDKSRGSGSANEFLKVVSALMTPPKVDWRELFRRKFNAAFTSAIRGRSYTSYKRVDRRSPGKMIFPGRISYQPKAMMGIDTSGSMDKRDYEAVLIEAEGIMKKGLRAKGSLQVFSVDTTIKNTEIVKDVKSINLYGGGGTDMSIAFAYVNSLEAKERPNIFVLGTDGGTDWNSILRELQRAEAATYQSIILVTTKGGYDSVPAELHKYAAILDVSDGKNSW